jgi:DNA-binding MarR family transcriptional regulator
MDSVKDAFQRVKKDMDSLREEIDILRQEFKENQNKLAEVLDMINKNPLKFEPALQHINPATPTHNPTNQHTNPAHNEPFEPLKTQILSISTGNEGVPTDRQTNQQTDRHIQNTPKNDKNTIENAAEILDSLDSIKKELRLKFKNLTEQEILVFSTIYQMEEESGHTDYRSIAQKLKLTESSIRDYIGKIIKKGIPVDKKRVNNKNIQLSISPNLKKIASLSTILSLREL